MSKITVIFTLILMDIINESHEVRPPQTTMNVLDRVKILKYKLKEQIKKSQRIGPIHKNLETPIVDENLEYVDSNLPITPIQPKDPRKKKGFKLAMIKTTPKLKESEALRDIQRQKDFEHHAIVPMKRKKHSAKSKITDLFYRRMHESNIVNPWLHCIDLLTPYLTGQKVNMTKSKRVTFTDNVVVRLAQLLTEDLAGHTRDDVASILYQISNLSIRLFQWDINAIKLILNVINPAKEVKHSFMTLKYGLKIIFQNWNLSYESDLGALLKHTTVFRPPCMMITKNEGSTKTSKSVRYTKTKPPKKVCTGGVNPDDGKPCVGTWIDK